MQIAITGAGGQVGSQLLADVAERGSGIQTVGICRNAFSAKKLSSPRYEIRVGSLLDSTEAARALAGCDTVIHCALSWENLARRDSVNLQMIRAITRAGIRRLIFISTVAVYGSCIESGVNTFAHPHPDSDYGRDKVICEHEVVRLSSEVGRQGLVLRLGHVYGPRLLWSRRILALALDNRFKLPFNGKRLSNAVRIDRVSDAIHSLLESNTADGVFDLTDEPNRSWREVFDWHTQACGLSEVPGLSESESSRLREQYLDLKRMRLVRSGAEIAGLVIGAVEQVASASNLIKSIGRKALESLPTGAQQALRGRHVSSLVARELKATSVPDLWEPSLGLLFSDPAPGPVFPRIASFAGNRQVERDIQEKLRRWYSLWASPDGLWRE